MTRIPLWFLIFLLLGFGSCSQKSRDVKSGNSVLKTGLWRGVLSIQGQELPFQLAFERKDGQYIINIINGEEQLELDEVFIHGDSIEIPMHIFDAVIKAKIISEGQLLGEWIKPYADDYKIPFEATFGHDYRFKDSGKKADTDFNGQWAVEFIRETNNYMALGIFEQEGKHIHGTFMTQYGDYRFLDGIVEGHTMKLSTFDGSHAFLFEAVKQQDGSLKGEFWSGKSGHIKWIAHLDADFSLPDPLTLTHLKPGYEQITFQFPDVDGRLVSLDDERFKGKVVLVQILGSWCPNCMDETKFLTKWYDKNKDKGIEIIGLAFERKDDFEYASARVRRLQDKLEIHYPVLIAGSTSEESKAKALPMLEKIVSFPTLIYLDRKHKIRRIYSGFSGPGTGSYYEQHVEEFNLFTNKLLEEE